jgi:hypothetical protein
MESYKEDGTMHRILHYVVMANRLRAPLAAHDLVPQVAVNWNKAMENTPIKPSSLESGKEGDKLPLIPLTSSPAG